MSKEELSKEELLQFNLKQLFLDELLQTKSDEEILDFCRKKIIHGTPYVFRNNDDEYYGFRKHIAQNFNVYFHEVYIVGSAKLGFSPYKERVFDLESDIDTALVSHKLFDEIMEYVRKYQMDIRSYRINLNSNEYKTYNQFLRYTAIGWLRPDLLPLSLQQMDGSEIRQEWFDFFDSISNGKSNVGNYPVAAGVFKSYFHLEQYLLENMTKVKNSNNELIKDK